MKPITVNELYKQLEDVIKNGDGECIISVSDSNSYGDEEDFHPIYYGVYKETKDYMETYYDADTNRYVVKKSIYLC